MSIVDLSALGIDSSQIKPSAGTAPVPAGYYGVIIEETEKKPTAASTPEHEQAYLQFKLKIIRGAYADRYLFANLNLWNANPAAVEIAYGELSAYAHAIGHIGPIPNTQIFLNKPFLVKVSVRAAGVNKKTGDSYDESNQIKKIEAWDESKLSGGNAAPGLPPAGFAAPSAPALPPAGFAPPPQQAYAPPAQQAYAPPQQAYAPQPQQVQPPAAAAAGQQPWDTQPQQPVYAPPAQQQQQPAAYQPPVAPQQAPPPFAQGPASQELPQVPPQQAGAIPAWAQGPANAPLPQQG